MLLFGEKAGVKLLRLATLAAAIACACLLPHRAALAQAACPIGPPKTVSASSYTLTHNDQCSVIIFTSPSSVAVTAPAANTVPAGFQAMLFSISGGAVVSSASTINAASSPIVFGGGQSGILYGDGVSNYSWLVGTGLQSVAANPSLGTLNRAPGVLAATSPTVFMPNGLLQFTNSASFRSGS